MDTLKGDFLQTFGRRITNIIPLELGAAVVAAHRVKTSLFGANVNFFIDNQSVQRSLLKGRCKANDVNRLIKVFSDITSGLGTSFKFHWIPSKWNLSDLPSRGKPISEMRKLFVTSSIRHICDAMLKQKYLQPGS
jgi:hypothetical protein